MCVAPLVPIAVRLSQLQILEHRQLATRADAELRSSSSEVVPRGRILDRAGRVLAESLPSWSAFLDPGALRRAGADSRRIAAALGLPAAEVARKARGRGRFVWLKRRIMPEEAARVRALGVAGAGVLPDETRFYPNGALARGLLGLVGEGGKGLSGIELAYDRTLSGESRKVLMVRDGKGRSVAAIRPSEQAPPPDLTLTLDRNIQHYAEEALAEAVERHRPAKAVLLVQDPRSGDLLAVAEHPADPLKAPALQETYEPGSTFKLVTMAAVLEEGVAGPGEIFDAEGGRWQVVPSVFVKDHEPLGRLTLSEAMEKSSNIVLAKLGLRLGPERLHRRARAFGFGARTGLSFPGESPGKLQPPASMTPVVLANNAFGQGLSATPVQVAAAFSAVANGGTLLEPRLVRAVGGVPAPGPVQVRRVASPSTIRALGAMLEGVVLRGTGRSAAVPGFAVGGKTGTSQKVDPETGKYSRTRYVASFIGYAPAQDPRFTVLVLLDSPQGLYYGADVAAPVFTRLMRRLLALEGVTPAGPGAGR